MLLPLCLELRLELCYLSSQPRLQGGEQSFATNERPGCNPEERRRFFSHNLLTMILLLLLSDGSGSRAEATLLFPSCISLKSNGALDASSCGKTPTNSVQNKHVAVSQPLDANVWDVCHGVSQREGKHLFHCMCKLCLHRRSPALRGRDGLSCCHKLFL